MFSIDLNQFIKSKSSDLLISLDNHRHLDIICQVYLATLRTLVLFFLNYVPYSLLFENYIFTQFKTKYLFFINQLTLYPPSTTIDDPVM